MLRLPTVLLLHETLDGSHYDWLLGDPRDPDGRLWTARVGLHSSNWAGVPSWDLEPIAAHRRIYLKYEGPLSGGRGKVRRVDEGFFVPLLWTDSRCVLQMEMQHFTGRVMLQKMSESCWRGKLIEDV